MAESNTWPFHYLHRLLVNNLRERKTTQTSPRAPWFSGRNHNQESAEQEYFYSFISLGHLFSTGLTRVLRFSFGNHDNHFFFFFKKCLRVPHQKPQRKTALIISWLALELDNCNCHSVFTKQIVIDIFFSHLQRQITQRAILAFSWTTPTERSLA